MRILIVLYGLLSTLLVSALLTFVIVPYIIRYIAPLSRSLDYSSCGLYKDEYDPAPGSPRRLTGCKP